MRDVRTLDVDDVFRKWANKNSKNFKQGSLRAYARRWPIAVRSFIEYADDPAAWKAPASDKPVVLRREKRPETGAVGLTGYAPEVQIQGRPSGLTAPGLVEYPFPLREGRLAYLRLPADLQASEVKRLTSFLNTLAVDEVTPE